MVLSSLVHFHSFPLSRECLLVKLLVDLKLFISYQILIDHDSTDIDLFSPYDSFLIPFVQQHSQLWVIIFSMLVIGLGLSAKLVSSFVDCLNYNIKVRGYPDEMSTYGMVSALFFSSCSVGAFVGPSAGGYLLETFGYRWSCMYIVLLDALMIILFVAYKLRQRYSDSDLAKRERLVSTGSLVKNRSYSQSVHTVA